MLNQKKKGLLLKKGFLIAGLLLMVTWQTNAQNQANNWYFGDYAGLNFSTGNPVPILDGALSTWEGCSSISNESGTIRFYTDGISVWDRHNEIMPNGNNLMGNPSSTQSGIIVPKPGSSNLYYIFTIDEVGSSPTGGANGLRYSLVDMNKNGFLGEVVDTVKNVLLTAPMCEKLTAIGHANGTDIWVISQKWETNDFYAYLITSTGVVETPVISSAGIVIQGDIENAKGYMKVSPDGNKLAKANSGLNNVELFDFSTTTGMVSDQNIITLSNLGGHAYGIEFSPNGEILYVSTWKSNPGQLLLQFDLTAPDVAASKVQIGNGVNGGLQLAPDNRIYVAQRNGSNISVINYPNELGTACQFSFGTVSLGGNTSNWGLPPFITSFFSFNPGYNYGPGCYTDSTEFHENSSSEPDSLIWDFGDAASGSANNTSTDSDPKHLFSSVGFYFVKLTVWISGVEGSVTHLVRISPKPTVDLGNDTTFCSGDTLILDAGSDAETYLWQSGDTTNTFPADTTGLYYVKATNGTCYIWDTVDVTVLPSYFLQIDTIVCAGDTVMAGGTGQTTTGVYYDSLLNYIGCDSVIKTNLQVNDTFFIVNQLGICTGDSVEFNGIYQKTTGVYFDSLTTMQGCDSILMLDLTVYDIQVTQNPMGICQGDSVILQGEYQTQSGTYYDTLPSVWGCDSIAITILTVSDIISVYDTASICQGDSAYAQGDWQKTGGIYYDTAQSTGGCDSIHYLNLSVNPTYSVQWDTTICEGDSIYAGGDYQKQAGSYLDYPVTIHGCDSTVLTHLAITLLPVVNLGNDTSILNGSSITLDATGTPNATYLWQDGTTDSVYFVSDSGTYSVTVSNLCGFREDSIKVTIYFPPEDLECFSVVPNAFTPNGDGLNDVFKPVLQCPAAAYSMKIFDRWGKMIFETSDTGEGWDGTVNGNPVEHGTYAWTIFYKYTGVLHPGERTVKGVVNLIK